MKSPTAEIARIGGIDVPLSHRDKVIFPEKGYTKGDVIAYYTAVAPRMIALIRDHPLMLQRFPNGIHRPGFIQQDASDYFPEWVDRVTVAKKGGRIDHVVADRPATLAYLANQGVLTFHMWQSRGDKPDEPDRLVFDLDPPGDNFAQACATAKVFRTLLQKIGLTPYVMTTGSRGLHVVAPLERAASFDEVRAFARELGDWMVARRPEQLTTEHRIAKRGGRLFLDPLRNAYAHTAVAPYSLRARPEAPIATPLAWEELGGCELNARRFTLANILPRLKKPDPWKDFWKKKGSAAKARREFDRSFKRGA